MALTGKEYFQQGFHFGIIVAQSITGNIPIAKLQQLLQEVIDGETTLQPSPEDILRNLEPELKRKFGGDVPVSEEQIEEIKRNLRSMHDSKRGEIDKNNVEAAKVAMEVVGKL